MEKIRKTMRREDGFTLVELLAVIVILGIILAIAIPAIGNVIADSKTKAENAEKELILDAARIYITAENATVPSGATGLVLGVQKHLVGKGYLENIPEATIGTVTITKDASNRLTYVYAPGVAEPTD